MGQLSDKIKIMMEPEVRVPYDETSNNGLVILEKYIPEELLSEILCHVDHKTLLNCQLVCRQWKIIIQRYIWRKKAEMTLGSMLPVDKQAPWMMYYVICDKNPFYKNLIKNHSGEKGLSRDRRNSTFWTIKQEGGNGWAVENPPIGTPPLPEDPVFEGKNHCFVTSYNKCWKKQDINLVEEGFPEYLLDNMQPTIKVSEWYCCRWDCPAFYVNRTLLLKSEEKHEDQVLASHCYSKILENENQNIWLKFEHEFKNYGPGLRKINFCHGGMDRSFWEGHYGSKMAGACIKLEIPGVHSKRDPENDC